jgi:uncharacterized protein
MKIMDDHSDFEQIKSKALPILQQMGVTRSSLFGSYVRSESKVESDLDFLIEFPRGKNLFDLVELQSQLEEALGRKIDVVTYRSLHPLLENLILTEQIRIL